MKFIYDHVAGQRLFNNKIFKTFVNRLSNNGESSTVVLIPHLSSHFAMYEQWVVNRNTNKIIENTPPYKKNYVQRYKPEEYVDGQSMVEASHDHKFKPINGYGTDGLDVYVVKEIDGKPHIAVSHVDQDQDIDFAEYRYWCAESHMPDNPIPDWMDKRLYKYLAPTSDSKVMLMYDAKNQHDKSINDLYKNEDFIKVIEWLDKGFINKEEDSHIIIYPQDKYKSINKYDIGCYIIKHKPSSYDGKMQFVQQGGEILWNEDDGYESYPYGLKKLVESALRNSNSYTSFPDLLK